MSILNKAIMIPLIGFLLTAQHAAAQKRQDYDYVSMVQLICQPDSFNGKKITIAGYLHTKMEDFAVYESKDKADYLISDAITIICDSCYKAFRKNGVDDVYVEILGTFNQNNKGHMRSYKGSLNNIKAIRKLRRWYK